MEYKELRFPDISINTEIEEAANWDRKNTKDRQTHLESCGGTVGRFIHTFTICSSRYVA